MLIYSLLAPYINLLRSNVYFSYLPYHQPKYGVKVVFDIYQFLFTRCIILLKINAILSFPQMDIIVSAKNFKLTPSLVTYTEEKIGKIARFWSEIIRANVELSVGRVKSAGNIFNIRVWLEVPGPDLEAEVEAHDMHEGVDLVLSKLESQIRKARGKALKRHRKIK
ncbi:MAG: ribosome-associated translation inhibitor RaiA [Patescibacteria group bacterium]